MMDFIVTITDVRRVGYCVAGMRHWAKIHRLDFPDFLTNGISAQRLLDTNDHMAVNIVTKIKEQSDGRGW